MIRVLESDTSPMAGLGIMSVLAAFFVGAAGMSIFTDIRPWLKRKSRKTWDYIGAIEETL